MEISKELVIRYLHSNCNASEEAAVGKWLVSSDDHARQAMRWIEELTDQQEKTLLQMVLKQDSVWKETVSVIGITQEKKDRRKRLARRSAVLRVRRFLKHYGVLMVSILMLAFAYFLYHKSRIVDVETKFGETREISLPDGSEVTLNANSSIRYAYGWSGQERRVWLKGEAYFDIHQLDNDETFKVYLSDNHVVEVKGTEFNISDESGYIQILLKSGSILLHMQGDESDTPPEQLIPGELVEIRGGRLARTRVDIDPYTSWAKNEWRFKNNTLQYALQKVKSRYNVSVSVSNEKLLSRRASGSISIMSKKADLVLTDISRLYKIRMQKEHGEITFSE